jgi:hypothetical protein
MRDDPGIGAVVAGVIGFGRRVITAVEAEVGRRLARRSPNIAAAT